MTGIRIETVSSAPSEALRAQVAAEVARELERRDALLQAVVHAAECFLSNRDWRAHLPEILRWLGEAAGVSRVYVFQNETGPNGTMLTSQVAEWVAPGVRPEIDNARLQRLSLRGSGLGRWEDVLSAGGAIEGLVARFPESERELLRSQQIVALAAVPVFVSGRWWGFIGFDDCVLERSWPQASLAVLRTAGNLLGLAVDRSEAQAAAAVGQRRLGFERAARAEAEAGEARAEFLAEASRVLSSSFDYETTLERIARMAVPFLADYCLIDVLDDGRLRRIALAHADPAKAPLLRELRAHAPDLGCGDNPIVRALRTRRAVVLRDVAEATPIGIAPGCAGAALAGELAPRGAMFVPLAAPAGVLGVVTFVATSTERVFDHADLTLAEELATRTALAVGNAQLFHEAQQATRARDELLSVVAHDLRNPLGVVLNGAELLLELGVEERPRHFAEMIRAAATSMSRLITDLLEVSRIESGRVALELSPLRLAPLVDESVSVLRPLAEARELDLDVHVLDPDVTVRADPARIAQVFSNLVGNAFKFTEPGGRVAVVAETAGDDVRFTVADTGPGIAPEDLPHIFGRFWQGKPADRRGIGLGLAIAKGVVEAHGGRIWAESTPGQGARFFFTIPATRE